jgi:hypothetical protein
VTITRNRRRLALALLLGAAIAVPNAVADSATISCTAAAPWSDPQHQGPLELLAGQVASQIAGHPVSVRCDSQAEWTASGLSGGAIAFSTWGAFSPSMTLFADDGHFIDLSPAICESLQTFAQATVKPTKCAATHLVTVKRWTTRWVWKTVKGKRIRVRQRTLSSVSRRQPLPGAAAVPCFSGSDSADRLPADYTELTKALETLAHEAIHMRQDTAGQPVPPDSLVEAQAECGGMQQTAFVAEQFGDSADDAQSIAQAYWQLLYPSMQIFSDPYITTHPYWSAECKPGGALDERPSGATLWP